MNCVINFEPCEEPPLTPGLCQRFKAKPVFFTFGHPSIKSSVIISQTLASKLSKQVGFMTLRNQFGVLIVSGREAGSLLAMPVLLKKYKDYLNSSP